MQPEAEVIILPHPTIEGATITVKAAHLVKTPIYLGKAPALPEMPIRIDRSVMILG